MIRNEEIEKTTNLGARHDMPEICRCSRRSDVGWLYRRLRHLGWKREGTMWICRA